MVPFICTLPIQQTTVGFFNPGLTLMDWYGLMTIPNMSNSPMCINTEPAGNAASCWHFSPNVSSEVFPQRALGPTTSSEPASSIWLVRKTKKCGSAMAVPKKNWLVVAPDTSIIILECMDNWTSSWSHTTRYTVPCSAPRKSLIGFPTMAYHDPQ